MDGPKREQQGHVCRGGSAAGRDAGLSAQPVTEAPRFDRRTHTNVYRKDGPPGIPTSK